MSSLLQNPREIRRASPPGAHASSPPSSCSPYRRSSPARSPPAAASRTTSACPGIESQRAQDLLDERFPAQSGTQATVVFSGQLERAPLVRNE